MLNLRTAVFGLVGSIPRTEAAELVFQEFEATAEAALPFYTKTEDKERLDMKEALKEHTKKVLEIDTRPLMRARIEQEKKNLARKRLKVTRRKKK